MSRTPFAALRDEFRYTANGAPLCAALDELEGVMPLAVDQDAAIELFSRLCSASMDVQPQTASGRRRIAGYLAAFGTRYADVVLPQRPRAFAHLSSGLRASAAAIHTRIRAERDADHVVPVLAAAHMRHGDVRPEDCLLLAAVIESLLRTPRNLEEPDRRRLAWYGAHLFACWLEPSEVAMLAHERWLNESPAGAVDLWRNALPDRRPLIEPRQLADMVQGHSSQPVSP